MNPLVRSIVTPFALLLVAGGLAWVIIRHEEQKGSRTGAREQTSVKTDNLALRIALIESARKAYHVTLETERIAFEQAKQDAEVPELAELSHEVRLLRIELEHRRVLADIDKKYPPPNPAPFAPDPAPLPPNLTPVVPELNRVAPNPIPLTPNSSLTAPAAP